MQQYTQQDEMAPAVKISRAAMEEELGEAYKRCWAIAFRIADKGLDFDEQIERLSREFELIRPQAEWFIRGALAILSQKEKRPEQKPEPKPELKNPAVQRDLSQFSSVSAKITRQTERYVSQLEMMSFIEDIEQMSGDVDYSEYWEDLAQLKQTVLEQQCATEKEVLRVFDIRTMVQREKEEKERYFDAYPVSTDAWENGHFDINGEVNY
jgi:DNA-binding XRE family transcriptional regulator